MSFDEEKHLVELSIAELEKLRQGMDLVIAARPDNNRDYLADSLWNRIGDEIRAAKEINEKLEADTLAELDKGPPD